MQRDNMTFSCATRAQGSLDLAFAIALFLGGIAFIIFVNGGLFFPTGISTTDTTPASDAVADELLSNTFTSYDSPRANITRLESFFVSYPAGQSVNETVSVNEDLAVNVTIRHADTGDVYSLNGTDLARGDPILPHASTVTRTMTIEDNRTHLEVTTWNPP